MDIPTPETEAEALRVYLALREIVANKPKGYTYADDHPDDEVVGLCFYLDYEIPFDSVTQSNDIAPIGPACIVGHLAVRDGVPFHTITEWEHTGIDGVRVDGWSTLRHPHVVRALREAQAAQDSGKTWAAAVKQYRDTLLAECGIDLTPHIDN